jgi:hypothetical protein
MPPAEKFTFRKHSSIGAAAAEDDAKFLNFCFVDTGDLATLLDRDDPRRIILGRTGMGKSALLAQLGDAAQTITLNPEVLSFNYVTNNTVLQFFLTAGVKLDLFFKLLWRHAFTVELLKRKYHIQTEADSMSVLQRLFSAIAPDKSKERALRYIQQWGPKFWENTEARVKELTSKVEEELTGSVRAKFSPVDLNAATAARLSEEEKVEVVQRGQTVINAIQMKELTNVLEFLAEDVFNDDKERTYVCVDKLDENWVDEKFRYLLIRSLIETIKDFFRVGNVKIVAVLRTDLLERVFRFTRDAGFQEEKYRSLYLPVRWTKPHLVELLDRRIDHLIKQTYTKETVTHLDVLDFKVGKVAAIDYMIERTSMRPRELIEFFNACLVNSEGKARITKHALSEAEGRYSKYRLRSLQDEWIVEYPSLIEFSHLLKKQPRTFAITDVNTVEVADYCLAYTITNCEKDDSLSTWARNVAEGRDEPAQFLCRLFYVFYRAGLVALKTSTFDAFQWSFEEETILSATAVDLQTKAAIHPMFFRVLGTIPDNQPPSSADHK